MKLLRLKFALEKRVLCDCYPGCWLWLCHGKFDFQVGSRSIMNIERTTTSPTGRPKSAMSLVEAKPILLWPGQRISKTVENCFSMFFWDATETIDSGKVAPIKKNKYMLSMAFSAAKTMTFHRTFTWLQNWEVGSACFDVGSTRPHDCVARNSNLPWWCKTWPLNGTKRIKSEGD